MEKISDFNQFHHLLNNSHSIFVILPLNPNQDIIAAGLSLYLSLKKEGKEISVFCSEPMRVEFSSLVGVDKIKRQLEGRNLVISFDCEEEAIEKVSYYTENNKLNLVIQPKEGYPPLSSKKVKYFYSGINADIFLLMGTSSFQDIGEIYFKNKEVLEKGKTVSLDLTAFGAISYSEVIANLLSSFRLPTDEDIATNLLAGIEEASASFSFEKTTPGVFEAAAFCLKAGGHRPVKKSYLKPGELLTTTSSSSIKKEKKVSPDWLTPKIYKGNTAI